MALEHHKKLAVFRAEASVKIGGGHVFRCLTLADALQKQGWNCCFLTADETHHIVPILKQSGHEIRAPEDMPEMADLLIVDHYELDYAYESACRAWAKQILVIDDLANRTHDCDVLLDQNLGRVEDDYRPLVPPHCRLMIGPNYALLRPQFAQNRAQSLEKRMQNNGHLHHVLLSFGASDPHNYTKAVSEKLSDFPFTVEIADGKKMNMAALMTKADLSIGAGGATSWERCCLGLPTLLIVTADNQIHIADALHKEGAAYSLGKNPTLKNITKSIETLYNNPKMLCEMSRKAALLCDGTGTEKVVEQILS